MLCAKRRASFDGVVTPSSKFGLSVQAQVWQEVERDYGKFADTVRWRKDREEWHLHSELIFTLNAPRGHLPAAPFFSQTLAVGWTATLETRLNECKNPDRIREIVKSD